jgi:hypothetical protein
MSQPVIGWEAWESISIRNTKEDVLPGIHTLGISLTDARLPSGTSGLLSFCEALEL